MLNSLRLIKATQGPTQPTIEQGHRGLRKRSRSRGPSLDRYTVAVITYALCHLGYHQET